MIARIVCRFFGHKRGRRVSVGEQTTWGNPNAGRALIECPRCKSTWTRKVKAA